jgi:stage IV sporulation protein FB
MSDPSSWSLHLGRWWRVSVRVHGIFIAVAVFALYLCTLGRADGGLALGALSVAILFASVLAHELGHWFAALRMGSAPDPIVIGPLGGLGQREVQREPQMELVTAAAGPLVNLGILILTLPALMAAGASVSGLVSPLQPAQLTEGPLWLVGLKLSFWFNWLLLAVNLLPAFPFDGGRLLRCLLWPTMEHRGATQVAIRASKLTALGICVLAWLLRDLKSTDALPAWVPMVLVAAMIYFSAQHEGSRLEESDWEEDMLHYDFSQGYTSLERTGESSRRAGGSLRRWIESRRELRRRRRQSQEQDEERQVDAILMRLHEAGMEGLSAKERALLNRVSARYRSRQGS